MKFLFIKEILVFLFHAITTNRMKVWLAKQITGATKWEWDDATPDLYEAYQEKDYEKAEAAIRKMFEAIKRDLK